MSLFFVISINLKIDEGELVIITGANGSGKTTFGKCFNGLVPYSTGGNFKGRVEICGVSTLKKDVSELALYVGFVLPNATFVLWPARRWRK